VDAFVTHHVPLEETARGFALAIEDQRNALKVMIDVGE
jgi:threonine dehydrogenase-like Zn-dependent dehydrogenase